VALSVACWFGRKPAIFRGVAVGLGRGGVVTVHLRAGQSWRRDGLWAPCRRAWRGELDEAQVHRNARYELRALGVLVTSTSHGRGAVHSWSR
jgi:hypothetical protein